MKNNFQQEFALREDLIYLNHAGVAPWPLRTAKAVREFTEENLKEGSVNYLKWAQVEAELRRQARDLINARSEDDIAIMKNTSEALSVVAYGLDFKEGDNIVSSNQEFPSNRIVWESLAQKGVEFREADLNETEIPEEALFSRVDTNTRLITISSVQYSTGLQMDLKRISEFCRKNNILFCVDAIQSLGALRFDLQEIQADFVMADGHKWMLGPEGVALFYCNPAIRDRLRLNQYGWHMVEAVGDFDRKEWSIAKTARCFECGSTNMIGIHALNASLSLLLDAGMEYVESEVLKRSEYLFEIIQTKPGLDLLNSTKTQRYAGIITFRCHETDNAALYHYLTKNNVVCALRANAIRLSPHFYTPYEKLDQVIDLAMKFSDKN